MKLIPRHCLVISFGVERLHDYFENHEIVTPAAVERSLVGAQHHHDISALIYREVMHLLGIKLSLGCRIVVSAVGLSESERLGLATRAAQLGVPVFYLIDALQEITPEMRRGDGIAEVVLHPTSALAVVNSHSPTSEELKSRFAGVTAVGDVHGMLQSLLSAISWARSRRHYLLFMGDILDYGAATLDVADEVYRVVMRGEGELILGNHERKIMRWLDGHKSRLSEGNRVTTNALAALGDSARDRWTGRFRGLYGASAFMRSIDNVTFAHAAVHPSFWAAGEKTRVTNEFALFGEIDTSGATGERYTRTYKWVDAIPPGQTVVVGHDARSTQHPVIHPGANGGVAYFVDTGAGKGGELSSVDFRFAEKGSRMECFNMF